MNFTSDGLDLSPPEYAALLQQVTSRAGFEVDNYSLGGAIAALEEDFARRLGKQAALFVPTGTLANHLAVRRLAGPGRRVLVQAESHLYNDSGDGAASLSGLTLVPLSEGRATISLDEVERYVERTAGGRVAQSIGAISIETPVRRRDHEMVDPAELDRVCDYARTHDIRLHLDGARLFNLPQHSGRSVRDYAARFDTVYVSLWKHFNAASGAILAGDRETIEGLFHTRRLFGGSLPYAWPLIAPAPQFVDTYETDYANAWRAAEQVIVRLEADGFRFRRLPQGTCRIFMAPPSTPSARFVDNARASGIRLAHPRPDSGEIPLQINPSILRRAAPDIAATITRAFRE